MAEYQFHVGNNNLWERQVKKSGGVMRLGRGSETEWEKKEKKYKTGYKSLRLLAEAVKEMMMMINYN